MATEVSSARGHADHVRADGAGTATGLSRTERDDDTAAKEYSPPRAPIMTCPGVFPRPGRT
jgi:hypothetical protein